MSRRLIVEPVQVVTNGDASMQIISNETNVKGLDQYMYEVENDGTHEGDYFVDFKAAENAEWETLPVTMPKDEDTDKILVYDANWHKTRFRFENTSGTGTMNVWFRANTQGA